MQNVSITQVMTPGPATIEPTTSVAAAEQLMRERRCHHLPVLAGQKVVGMVAAHDLLKALVLRSDAGEPDSELLRQTSLEHRHVAEIMQRNVQVLPQTATLLDAAHALGAGGFHAIPVTGAEGRLVGIVTSTDVIQALADDLQRAAGVTVQHTPPEGTAPARPFDEREIRALRDVYRAVRNYLRSGRAEIEHGRLLQAQNRAREALHAANIDL